MENGTKPNSESEIDRLHAQLTHETASAKTAEKNTADDAGGDPNGSPDSGFSDNKDFCEEILATILRCNADATRREFLSDLSPITDQDQAERIADRAAMSPVLQQTISAHGARVLSKYKLAKFVSDEAATIGALLAWRADLRAARKDRDSILAKHAPKVAQTTPNQ